jgi:hypothetical protein
LRPMEDQDDGDRRGGAIDSFGHVWYIGTQIEDVTRERLQGRYDGVRDQRADRHFGRARSGGRSRR